jgi:transposase
VVVVAVPWARHASRFTKDFEDQVAWLASESSGPAVAELMRITWRSVGAIVGRVAAEARRCSDPLEGLSPIGIDEISHRKGHRYLVVVVDHDTGRLVWAAPGRDEATVGRFFDDLGPQRAARLTHVSADAASWIAGAVGIRAPQAILCVDLFHVVSWVTDALDEVRRDVWNQARRSGNKALGGELKGARYALWKNPEHLSPDQRFRLAVVAKINHPLYKAYLLKSSSASCSACRHARPSSFSIPGWDGHRAADWGRSWRWPVRSGPTAQPSRRPPLVQRPHRVHQHQDPSHRPAGLRLPSP